MQRGILWAWLGILCFLNSAPAAPPSKLLVVSAKSGNPEIYLVPPEGEWKNVTNDPAEDTFPVWSPDGTQFAFVSNRAGEYNIYVANADGSEPTPVTTEAKSKGRYCQCPSWSPDGERIVYMRRQGSKSEVVSVQLDGDRERILAENAWDPAWSPGGDKIVFTSLQPDGWQLFTIEPDGGKYQQIVTMQNKQGYVYPAWSPDGKQIAFTAKSGDGYEIHVCDADGGNVKVLTKSGKLNTKSTWSADGQQLHFWHDVDGDQWEWQTVDIASGKTTPFAGLKPEKFINGGRVAISPKP